MANLNARNDQLRREIATLERDLATLTDERGPRRASIDELRADLRARPAYAGLDAGDRSGVIVTDPRPDRRGRASRT